MALTEAVKDSITAEMVRQGISQRALARRLGVPQPYLWSRLSRSDKAKVEFTTGELEKVAEALGVPVAQLLTGASA